ncbi:HAD-IC family P-type ATPase [Rhodococcus sp. IEGM 1381]|uniref:HAD-IC family P-type ATPase n=1 Tax=Rhodococcus sp. IEGM 1381 TaxID=3047085 RepID=UPI0024B69D9B|nr:HAD-IC family P-type ATPase [Rhodococcus sp. IEGM 1381]MDI9894491.1 HAD-IC family P-type ATPase [Rhodococcus sp. IEGM 1381]
MRTPRGFTQKPEHSSVGLTTHELTTYGLTAAEVAERVREGKTNALPARSGRTTRQILRDNVFTRINAMLSVLFLLVLTTGSLINGLFGLLIVCNSAIGIIQELRAKRTLDSLAIVGQARPVVRRDGRSLEIAQSDVVLDDVIEIGTGDQIVVDGEAIETEALEVDESLLTGEADPVDKQKGGLILSGSFVVSGTGSYRATKVGADAYAARLAGEASKFTLVDSELRSGVDRILRVITWLLVPAGLLTIFNQLVISQQGVNQAILGMVAALVPMIPEGLVLMTSIAFAVGVVRLGQRQCLVQELPAIEGLARVDVVCTDKTGTLTENGMRFAELHIMEGDRAEIELALAAIAALDPRPNASVQAIAEAYPHAPNWRAVAIAPFSSAKKWSGVSLVERDRHRGNWIVGAADVLLDPESYGARKATELGSIGLRVLLIATTDAQVDAGGQAPPGNLVPRALVTIEQRVRPDARDAVDYFKTQDVAVKIISGDNAVSVGAVAHSLGLGTPSSSVDSRRLPTESEELATVVTENVTFGRVRPDQKREMVKALQSRGKTVAMTGDGVNDVLALKDSDIGVAMGSGSSAARSVAQIVLLDNKFATLPYVVAEGRRVIGNIERVANLFLAKTVYAVLLACLVGLAGVGAKIFGFAPVAYPFQPIHVTIAAWFTIGVPAFIMSLAPNNERARSGFVGRVLRLAVPSGVAVGLATFLCYLVVNPGGTGAPLGGKEQIALSVEQIQASTAALITLLIGSLWVLGIVARPYNWWKLLLVGFSVVFYVVLFSIPMAQQRFFLDIGDPQQVGIGFTFGFVAIALIEAFRRVGSVLAASSTGDQ